MDVGGRLANAGIVLVVTFVIVVPFWFSSVGLYSWGLWPLGAIVRVGVWGVVLFGSTRIVHHLLGSPQERMLNSLREQMRREQVPPEPTKY
jgi:hypothetical protein